MNKNPRRKSYERTCKQVEKASNRENPFIEFSDKVSFLLGVLKRFRYGRYRGIGIKRGGCMVSIQEGIYWMI